MFSTPDVSGDKLIALYSILKTSREGEVKYYSYKAKNNKFVSGYSLLRAKTKISLNTLKKYVPVLIEMGLCNFDVNGDFILLGNTKLKKMYSRKLVPVLIGKSLLETSYNVISVRLHSKESYQKKEIAKKLTRSEQLKQGSVPHRLLNANAGKRALKYSYSESEEKAIIEKTILSLQGFSKLKDGSLDNKSKGFYWKNKLKQKGLVKTKREFTKKEKMSLEEYRFLKGNFSMEKNETYYLGHLVEETVSSFYAIDLINKKQEIHAPTIKVTSNKKAPIRMSFDMIKFWETGKGN